LWLNAGRSKFGLVECELERLLTPDQYLASTLAKYAVPAGPGSLAMAAFAAVVPSVRAWANQYMNNIGPSGSFAKGTAVAGTTDIDIFVSIKNNVPENLQQIYESLFAYAQKQYWLPKKQNVSIRISYVGAAVDLVPGRLQANSSEVHSLYRNKVGSWTQTNIAAHIAKVRQSGRVPEIRAIKIWRKCHGLDFPSFYLELTVIKALSGKKIGDLSKNVWTVLEYLRDSFEAALVMDPANTNNWIDEDLTAAEKKRVADAAKRSLQARTWGEVLW
jgi:hypothetical protein